MKISPISDHFDNVISVVTLKNRKNSLLSFRTNLRISSKYEIKAKKWIFWRLLSIFVHLFSLSLYAYAFCYSELNRQRFVQEHPERFSEEFQRREFLGKWKFLTRWNHLIQLIFFALSLGFDLLSLVVPAHIQHEHSKKSDSVKNYYAKCAQILDTLFHALVAPTAVVVTIMFWTLNFINPILVVSKLSVPEPFWLNHTVHSVVTIIVIIELFLTYHARAKIFHSILLAFIFIISYVSVLFYVGLVKNYWAYGIFNQLTNFQRILFIIGILILYFSVFGILHLIHKLNWSNQRITSFILGFEPTQLSTKKIASDQTVFSVPTLEQSQKM